MMKSRIRGANEFLALYLAHPLLYHVLARKKKQKRGSTSRKRRLETNVPLYQSFRSASSLRENGTCKEYIAKNHLQTLESLSSFLKEVGVYTVFSPLTIEEEIEVYYALFGSDREEVLVMHKSSNIIITRNFIRCLSPGECLNSEVINLYLELLKERERREPTNFLKCHFFNTYFYEKLSPKRGEYNYGGVKRWTTYKQLGYSLLDCDSIVVPIHNLNHWCLAIINMKESKIQYFDSLNKRNDNVLENLAKYIEDEAKDKCMKNLNLSTWKREYVEKLPQQENHYDCGMFMIKYADFQSHGMPFNFAQGDIPYFRRRTTKEILKLRAD